MSNPIALASVSVGTPQDLTINGKIVRTAIIKTPLKGPVHISFTGPVGDKPAVHPDALYAMPKEHYQYWSERLALDINKMPNGYFGENLTIEGLDETQVKVGDVLHIGDVVKVQVVSSRTPCAKLAWRLGQDAKFLTDFSLSGKVGFFLKVITEGYIEANDPITHIPTTDQNSISISALAKTVGNIDKTTEIEVKNVLNIEYLGFSAKSVLQRRLALLNDLKLSRAGRWQNWRRFRVYNIIDEALDIKSIWLKPEDSLPIAGYRPGQFLTCKLAVSPSQEVIRTWTISDFAPFGKGYRLSIKKEPNGTASKYIHESIEIGSVIDIKPPNGSFVLDRCTGKSVVLISAGIGITPMLSMLKAHTERDDKYIPLLYFVHFTKNSLTHPFKEEIQALTVDKDYIKTLQYYTAPLATDELGKDFDIQGRFSLTDLDTLMQGNKTYWGNRWHDLNKQDGTFYICGPLAFQDNVKTELIKWGVKAEKIFTESFVVTKGEPEGVKADKAKIRFAKSNITANWSWQDDLTFLELAEKHGVNIPNACRMGVCETCEVNLSKGQVFYDNNHLSKRDKSKVLTCCSKPGSKEIVLEI